MILIAFGTRPEIIKLFPVIEALRTQGVPFQTLFSGQQLDLYEDVKDLVPEPDFSFAETYGKGGRYRTLGDSFTSICEASEALFRRCSFDIVVVQGDTTTAWALAQMAFYNGVQVAHVEAGLRTFDICNPYPEELNRTLIGHVAAFNFAPTRQAYGNLMNSGARNVYLVGNTIVDAVEYFRKHLGLSITETNTVVVTLHRRENHAFMAELFDDIQAIALDNPELELIFPIHPNPNVGKHRQRLTASNINIIAPVGYGDMLKLMAAARFLISDSGGIQEEAVCLGKKVIIAREKTERPETIETGIGILAGRRLRAAVAWAKRPPLPVGECPYGNGDAAHKIVDILGMHLKNKSSQLSEI